jgi:hypothetical protein
MGCHTFASWIGRSTPEIDVRTRHYAFCACRCLRNELRRVIRAFAARTASFLVSFFFGGAARERSVSLASGNAGNTGAGIVALCATGCILIGPAHRGLLLCIGDNALPPNLFDAVDRRFGAASSSAGSTKRFRPSRKVPWSLANRLPQPVQLMRRSRLCSMENKLGPHIQILCCRWLHLLPAPS